MEEDATKAGKASGSAPPPSTAHKAVAASDAPAPGSQAAAAGKTSKAAQETVEDTQQHIGPGEWRQLIWDALHASAPPSRFACSGRLETPCLCPNISVAGVGRLGLPLSKEQAVSLRSVARQAPHGRGFRTVVDTAVRDGFQVDASQVHIGSSWQPILESTVSQITSTLAMENGPRTTLRHDSSDTGSTSSSDDSSDDATHNADNGTACNIEARLYKLLLYEQGGHFIAHQDTEKERGMIGTLVVQLPTAEGHTGGSLTVRHKGQQFTHHFAEDSTSSLQYAAFFADCEQELSPITSMRLVLVYNLVWVGPHGAAPRKTPTVNLVNKSPAEVQLRRAFRAWEQEIDNGGQQTSIAFLLDYKYTEANLCFNHLKGTDRAMVRALSACKELEAHVVLVTQKIRIDYDDDDVSWMPAPGIGQ